MDSRFYYDVNENESMIQRNFYCICSPAQECNCGWPQALAAAGDGAYGSEHSESNGKSSDPNDDGSWDVIDLGFDSEAEDEELDVSNASLFLEDVFKAIDCKIEVSWKSKMDAILNETLGNLRNASDSNYLSMKYIPGCNSTSGLSIYYKIKPVLDTLVSEFNDLFTQISIEMQAKLDSVNQEIQMEVKDIFKSQLLESQSHKINKDVQAKIGSKKEFSMFMDNCVSMVPVHGLMPEKPFVWATPSYDERAGYITESIDSILFKKEMEGGKKMRIMSYADALKKSFKECEQDEGEAKKNNLKITEEQMNAKIGGRNKQNERKKVIIQHEEDLLIFDQWKHNLKEKVFRQVDAEFDPEDIFSDWRHNLVELGDQKEQKQQRNARKNKNKKDNRNRKHK